MNEFAFRRKWGPIPMYENVIEHEPPENKFVIVAGPCSMESEEQLSRIANHIKGKATHLRSGVFRAGTYGVSNFGWIDRGLIKSFHDIANENGMKNIIEVLDYRDLNWLCEFADCFQVGARQTQNYTLLKEVGKTEKPVFIKRNMGMTVDELLGACNYVLSSGCKQVYIIERGTSTYHNDVRWTPTVHVIPSIESICNIPVIWDASHACGRRDIVPKVCLAGVASGANGVLIETHYNPEKSLSDADQAISLDEFDKLIDKIHAVRRALNG